MLCITSSSSSPAPLQPPRRSRAPSDRAAPPGIAVGGNVRLSLLSVQRDARRSGPAKVKSKFATAATVQENTTMAATIDDADHLPIYKLDPKLEEFKDHFSYRMKRYLDQKSSIEENEGILEEFSKGYLKFGINTNKDGTVYREWAPAAHVVPFRGVVLEALGLVAASDGIALVALVPAWRMSMFQGKLLHLNLPMFVLPSITLVALVASIWRMLCRLGRSSWVDALPPSFGSGGCLAAVVLLVLALCSGRMLRRPGCDRWVDALPPFASADALPPCLVWADALPPFFFSGGCFAAVVMLFGGCFATAV